MGLPGSGKTTFVEELKHLTKNFDHYNADKIREEHQDYDFSDEGRLRQAQRMLSLSKKSTWDGQHSVMEFVCPKIEFRRDIIQPDILIWMNTNDKGRFEDTNKVFEPLSGDDLLHPYAIFIIKHYDYCRILDYLCDVLDRKF